jgi:hypothetical protein
MLMLTSPVPRLARRKTARLLALTASRRGGQARSAWPGRGSHSHISMTRYAAREVALYATVHRT